MTSMLIERIQSDLAAPERPTLTRRDRVAGAAFGFWMIVGLFLDGWAHDNNKPESFFTPWHAVLYSGFAAAAVAALAIVRRHHRPGEAWSAHLPKGHGLTLAALGLFAIGAVGDLVWHEVFGVEVTLEALLSPTHLVLLAGGLVALSAPVRSAWGESGTADPTLRQFLPTVSSIALLTALIGFFLLYLSPFVNDAGGTRFDRAPGMSHDHPSHSVAELQQVLGIASILLTTVLVVAPVYLVLARWRPPSGTFTVFFSVVILLFVGLDEFAAPWLVVSGLAAGIVTDAVARRWPAWATGTAAIASLWTAYFAVYQLTEGGVAWSAPVWAGATFLAALIAAGIGLVAQPPAILRPHDRTP